MRMTSKGQLTVPKDIREDLGLGPGSAAGFEKNERGEVVLVNLDKRSGESEGQRLVRALTEFGDRMRREGKVDPDVARMTTDEYMELIRGYSEDADDPGFKRPA
jgi:AbrB family looped-hinge helix DNA binding protein